jgi:tripartite-type tricarboxylate transporter receptor subunit TctC
MPNLMTLRCACVAIAAVVLGGAHVTFAQNYPSRVIKIIVPFAVGGQPDTIARLFDSTLPRRSAQR